MNLTQKVALNTFILSAGKFLDLSITLVMTIFIARYLEPAGYGKYVLVFVIISFAGILSDMGINHILTREISKDISRARTLLGTGLIIKVIHAMFCLILTIIIINLTAYPADIKLATSIASVSLIFLAVMAILEITFQVKIRNEFSVITRFLISLISLGMALVIISLGGGLIHLVSISVISALLGALITLLFSRRFVKPIFKLDLNLWKNIFYEAFPLGAAFIFYTIYHRVDMIMLSIMKGNQAVGLYGVAYKFIDLGRFLPGIFFVSVFPIMARQFKENREELKRTFRRSFDFLVILAIPLCVVVTVLARKVVAAMYGEDYSSSALALQILIWVVLFMFINNLSGFMLLTIGKQKISLYLAIFCTFLNIGLNLYFIPRWSFIGASVTTLLTEILLGAFSFGYLSKTAQINPSVLVLAKSVFSGLVLAVLLIFLIKFNPFIYILVPILAYLITLYLTKAISKEDLNMVFGKASQVSLTNGSSL